MADTTTVTGNNNKTIEESGCPIKFVSNLVSLLEKKDEQISQIINLVNKKDEQIDRLLSLIEKLKS